MTRKTRGWDKKGFTVRHQPTEAAMPRAFIQNGVWRARPAAAIDPAMQRQATLRVSIAAAVATLAFATLHGGAETSPAVAPKQIAALPEMISFKADDRVPQAVNPFRRRAPLAETAEVPSAPPETTASPRTMGAARAAEAMDGGMIRAGDATYRLAGIVLPENGQMCRRLDGLAVACADRAHSYLQLLVKGRAVSCERAPQRTDGPHEANCRIGDADVAEQMVRQGWARAGEQPEERFMLAEAAAKKQRLGIWRE
jgi:endonuclease YncB( thermonuclease family)